LPPDRKLMKKPKEFTVLYVDDETPNLRGFKSAFRRLYNVHIADHPNKGIDIVQQEKIDIVVSDHRMPDLIGTDFLREVHRFNPNIRRIILSGFVKKEELKEANEEFGIHAYISKPWDFENVQEIFTKLMSVENPDKMTYDL
jgi:response regulator RpfG family c-di-GMP phosphodiesterase